MNDGLEVNKTSPRAYFTQQLVEGIFNSQRLRKVESKQKKAKQTLKMAASTL